MSDQVEAQVIAVVQDTLRPEHPDLTIAADDSMDTVVGWDSLQASHHPEFGQGRGVPEHDFATHVCSCQEG